MIARVEPLTRTRAVRGPFDYVLAEGQEASVGTLLRVPFSGGSTLAVVVAVADSSLSCRSIVCLSPRRCSASGPPPDLVELALWMARRVLLDARRGRSTLVLAPGGERRGARVAMAGLVAELTDVGARGAEQAAD